MIKNKKNVEVGDQYDHQPQKDLNNDYGLTNVKFNSTQNSTDSVEIFNFNIFLTILTAY